MIDAWREQTVRTYTGEIDLPRGAIPIKMEYYEQAGLAVAQLSWSEADAPGTTQKILDQSINGDRWVSLGTYNFNGTGNEYVSLSDVTGEAQRTRLIAFDAAKWVPRRWRADGNVIAVCAIDRS